MTIGGRNRAKDGASLKTFSVAVPPDIHTKLLKIADEEDRSISNVILRLIKIALMKETVR